MTQERTIPAALLSIEETARALAVCPDVIRKWARKGLLPRVPFGKRGVLFDPLDFPALIAALKAGADDENENAVDDGDDDGRMRAANAPAQVELPGARPTLTEGVSA